MPPAATARIAAVALAVLLPAAVLGAGLAWLLRAPEQELSVAAQAMEKALSEAQPEVLVVGNSLAGRDVDEAVLAAGIADRPIRVGRAWEAGTLPANWYLFLENRVYANDHEPHALVFCIAPRPLVQTDLTPELARRSLADHAGEYEPVVYAKALGQASPSPWLMRLRRRRGELQQGWAALVRDASVGLFQGDRELDLLARGEAAAAPALARVFEADGAVDITLHHRVIPVVEVERKVQVRQDAGTVAGSFVPDLLDIAEEHGSRVIFAVMPVLASTSDASSLSPLVLADLIRLLNARGAAWIDFRAEDWPDNLFMDPAHLNSAGRERLSRELAARLMELDVLGEGPFPPNRVPLALEHRIHLEGSPPDLGLLTLQPDPDGQPCRFWANVADFFPLSDAALASAGVGNVSPLVVLEDGRPLTHLTWPGRLEGPCAGAFVPQAGRLWVSPAPGEEPPRASRAYRLAATGVLPVEMEGQKAWFVYPGTSLVVDLGAWQGAPGDLEVLVGLEPLLGEGAPSVTVDGSPVPLAPDGRRSLAGSLVRPTPAGPWQIRLASPIGGPWLLVRRVAVRAGDESQDLLGGAHLMLPPTADLLADLKQAEVLSPPEPAHFPLVPERYGRGQGVRSPLPGLDDLTAEAVSTRVPCRRCSPLHLLEDGVLRNRPELSCAPVVFGRADRTCHEPGFFAFTALDGSDPFANGHRYEVILRPDRRDGQRWWLYPGDHARLPFSGAQRRLLRDGAGSLHLDAALFVMEGREGQVHLRVTAGDALVLDETFPAARFGEGALDWSFPERQEVRGQPVVLELSSDADAPFVLLTSAELRE
ncbi:MAG: hypothetical protein ABIO70_31045 [Pseudomonadota bacterium]